MSNLTEQDHKFIHYLQNMVPDRSAMANLRRGLGKPPGIAYDMDKYVLPRLPESPTPWQENTYYLVASLFAYWHQGKERSQSLDGKRREDRNLGRSLNKLVFEYTRAGISRDEAQKRLEKRLSSLLDASIDDLPEYLRQTISLLKAKEVPVDWTQLLCDIQHWNTDTRFIQHEWAKGFWISKTKELPDEISDHTEE